MGRKSPTALEREAGDRRTCRVVGDPERVERAVKLDVVECRGVGLAKPKASRFGFTQGRQSTEEMFSPDQIEIRIAESARVDGGLEERVVVEGDRRGPGVVQVADEPP